MKNKNHPTPKGLSANCENCPVHNSQQLIRMGVEVGEADYVVALAGNPNTGKSTVFNALTGLRQHTGNWPGKTVTRAEGGFVYHGKSFKLVDLPGTYSLLSNSVDEEVARNFILFGNPDVTVIVTDATRLERNLNLVFQILEITDRAVVVLNLMDEARRRNLEVDDRKLARRLGVPVVPTAARNREGIDQLLEMIYQVATGQYVCRPRRASYHSPKIQKAVTELERKLKTYFPELPNARWVALRLLEGDPDVTEAVRNRMIGHPEQNRTLITKDA